jgi:hypothetical protein
MRAKFSSDTDNSSLRVSSSILSSAPVFNVFYSEEESKPVKLMLRALPLIQTHVRTILTPNVVPE